MNLSVGLNDSQIAMINERGTSMMLVMMQEELTEIDGKIIAPAKSYTIERKEDVIKLRDLLIDATGTPTTNYPPVSSANLWLPIRENALKRLRDQVSVNEHHVVNALSYIIRNTLGVSNLLALTEKDLPKVNRIVDSVVVLILTEAH